MKVGLVLGNRTQRMTCHAKVVWVKQDETAGGAFDERWIVGLDCLSLTDAEFQVLLADFVKQPESPLELLDRWRDAAEEIPPVSFPGKKEVRRTKAVTLPVNLIDEIDSKRGDIAFSQFVTTAVKEYLKNR